MDKKILLNELKYLEKELLTNYKKKYYSEAYNAEVDLLNRLNDIIKMELVHKVMI